MALDIFLLNKFEVVFTVSVLACNTCFIFNTYTIFFDILQTHCYSFEIAKELNTFGCFYIVYCHFRRYLAYPAIKQQTNCWSSVGRWLLNGLLM